MKPLRILLAEDEPIIAMLMTRVLRALGHEVCAVEATEAGLVAAAALHRPQLMIVDARLRRSSGVAAVATILLQGFVPHVFVSGAGIDGLPPDAVLLPKPFTEAELIVAMRRAMAASNDPAAPLHQDAGSWPSAALRGMRPPGSG